MYLAASGLAIGSLSLICYAPDVIQPLIEASLLGDSPSAGGYQSYYRWAAMILLLGSGLALWLNKGFNVGNLIFKRSLSRTLTWLQR